jgi:Ca2+-binding RTX toxin-like protein
MAMKNTDMTATRFLMRLPSNSGQVREVVIEGSGLSYAGSGALTGGLVTSIMSVTSDNRSGDTQYSWTSAGVSVADLMAVVGDGFWNHVNTIGAKFPLLLAAYPAGTTGGGSTGGDDTGGNTGGGGDTGGGAVVPPNGITITGTSGKDDLRGENLGETIYGKEDDDVIFGGDGNDTIYGGSGDDRIGGDKGNDVLYGGSGNDRLRGDKGDDLVIDLEGNNRLRGNSGNDTLQSGTGRDVMVAGNGDDVIISGGGKDFAMGCAGADVFVFDGANTGTIKIKDFAAAEDRFDVAGLDSAEAALNAFLAEATQVGEDVYWTHGATTVRLMWTELEEIGLANFTDVHLTPVTIL